MCFLLAVLIFRFNILASVACSKTFTFGSLVLINSLLTKSFHYLIGVSRECSNLLVLFSCYCFCYYNEMIASMDLFIVLLLMMMNEEVHLLMVYQKYHFYLFAIIGDVSANQQILKALAQLEHHHSSSLSNLLNIDFPFKVAKFLYVN